MSVRLMGFPSVSMMSVHSLRPISVHSGPRARVMLCQAGSLLVIILRCGRMRSILYTVAVQRMMFPEDGKPHSMDYNDIDKLIGVYSITKKNS